MNRNLYLAGGVLLAALILAPSGARAQTSQWVTTGVTGRLIYVPDAQGDRILDFSNVGYKGRGSDLLPNDVPTVRTVSPMAGDDTANIQAAINQVAALPLQANGYRGAVLLTAGDYDIATQLNITASGVVLRGVGRDVGGTVLHARGTDDRPLVNIAGAGSQSLTGSTYTMLDEVVPAGANSFRINSTAGLAVGDTVRVERPGTQAWIEAVGMDQPDGEDPAWLPSEFNIRHDRVITRVEGDRVFLDAPVATSFEQQYGGGTLRRYTWSSRIQNVGIENLRAESDFNPALMNGSDFVDEAHSWTFISINRAQDVWVRNSLSKYFAFASVLADDASKWVTVDNVVNEEPVSLVTGERRYTFDLDGQMGFVTNSSASKGRHDFVNNGAAATVGPNVFHDSTATDARSDTGPHRRWSTATLFDNITVQGNQINAQNRGTAGTRHGWSGANIVVWNSSASSYRIQNPPTAQNWLIGSIGTNQNPPPSGNYDSHGTPVTAGGTDSLYDAQKNDSGDIRTFQWLGGSGLWSDPAKWDQEITPGVYSVQLRDYMLGDIDNFSLDAGSTGPDYPAIAPAWSATVAAGSPHPIVGFDSALASQNPAFTVSHQLGAGERVVHAFLAMSLKQAGGSVADDFVQVLDSQASHRLSFAALGWSSQINATTPFVGVVDMGPYLSQLQTGAVNVWVSDNTRPDWAIYTAAVATPKADPLGADVLLAGGQVRVEGSAPPIGSLQNGGAAASELTLAAGGLVTVNGDFAQTGNGSMVFEIGGSSVGQIGRLAVGDEAQLAGRIDLRTVNGFSPAVGSTFAVVSANTGITSTMMPPGVVRDLATDAVWGLEYQDRFVVAKFVTSLFGDLTGDNAITVADWTQFKAGYGTSLAGLSGSAAYLLGDLDGDGGHDLVDFSQFRTAFDQANGPGALQKLLAVPEPAAAMLALLGALAGGPGLMRRRILHLCAHRRGPSGVAGDILIIRAVNTARTVVVKDGTGNIKCVMNRTLDNTEDTMMLVFDGTSWLEVAFADNGL